MKWTKITSSIISSNIYNILYAGRWCTMWRTISRKHCFYCGRLHQDWHGTYWLLQGGSHPKVQGKVYYPLRWSYSLKRETQYYSFSLWAHRILVLFSLVRFSTFLKRFRDDTDKGKQILLLRGIPKTRKALPVWMESSHRSPRKEIDKTQRHCTLD